MTAQPFSMTVFEEDPSFWRWVLRCAKGAIHAASKRYASASKPLDRLAMTQSCAPAFS